MHETKRLERALLVVVKTPDDSWGREALAAEFERLVLSTEIEVEGLVTFNLNQPSPSLYIGKGKVEELAEVVKDTRVGVVIFGKNLNFTQQKNLENVLGVKTIDRTQLILDIFAKHAQTQEGILQVELAQLEYLLPRLRGKGIVLSRLGGGIGTRGPGEKKLEVDRRRISDRITHLKKDLKLIRQHRDTRRKKRKKGGVNTCSLVGYTNAGKSTLFNALTESNQTIASTLFTTLDTVSRALILGNNLKVVLSDTVGFVYKLPPNLIEAFKATLEELNYADLLLHIIDASNKERHKLMQSVNSILKDLKLDKTPTINVFNKIDILSAQESACLRAEYPQAVFISASKKSGLDNLNEIIYRTIFKDMVEVVVEVPFSRMDIASYLHDNYEILKTAYKEEIAAYWIRTRRQSLAWIRSQGLAVKEV